MGEEIKSGYVSKYKRWNELPVQERADIIKVAVRNGIYSPKEIRGKYNEFASGGNLYAAEFRNYTKITRKCLLTSLKENMSL